MKFFYNETLIFFFRKFCTSYILDLARNVRALRILLQKSTRIKELWALENHVLVNILLCSSHFTEIHQIYINIKLNNRYQLHHFCRFLYVRIEPIVRIILLYVVSCILGHFLKKFP